MKRFGFWILLAFPLLLLPGCGYQVGSLMHPQIKTVAIAPVVNETVHYNLSADVRSLLAERFMTDGSLKVVDMSEADCIVYARILSVKFSEVAWTSREERDDLIVPNQWKADLMIEYSVILPGRGTPLLGNRTTSGSAEFETGPEMEIGRSYGIRQAAYAAAKNVVSGVTEGW